MHLLRSIPLALVVFRFCVAFVLLALAFIAPDHRLLIVALTWAALISDILDGIIARRLGCDTDFLRQLDSAVDNCFWISVATVAFLLNQDVLVAWFPWIIGLLAAEALIFAVNRVRFGRPGATHAWSAKLFGLGLLAGFTEILLTGEAVFWFPLMIALGYLSFVDVLLIALLLPEWRRDVPSAWHAWKAR